MAEKRYVTGAIENLERMEDSKTHWGKYLLTLEGYDSQFNVAVPPDVNLAHELEPGYIVTLTESPKYNKWIVNSNSEFITGKPNPYARNDEMATESQTSATSSRYKKANAPTPEPAAKATPIQKTASTSGLSKKAVDWNGYQMGVRDPQMRMQTLIGYSLDVHKFCFQNELDPSDFFNQVMHDAKSLNKALIDYLSDDKNVGV